MSPERSDGRLKAHFQSPVASLWLFFHRVSYPPFRRLSGLGYGGLRSVVLASLRTLGQYLNLMTLGFSLRPGTRSIKT